jgi:hypothetical protein
MLDLFGELSSSRMDAGEGQGPAHYLGILWPALEPAVREIASNRLGLVLEMHLDERHLRLDVKRRGASRLGE